MGAFLLSDPNFQSGHLCDTETGAERLPAAILYELSQVLSVTPLHFFQGFSHDDVVAPRRRQRWAALGWMH